MESRVNNIRGELTIYTWQYILNVFGIIDSQHDYCKLTRGNLPSNYLHQNWLYLSECNKIILDYCKKNNKPSETQIIDFNQIIFITKSSVNIGDWLKIFDASDNINQKTNKESFKIGFIKFLEKYKVIKGEIFSTLLSKILESCEYKFKQTLPYVEDISQLLKHHKFIYADNNFISNLNLMKGGLFQGKSRPSLKKPDNGNAIATRIKTASNNNATARQKQIANIRNIRPSYPISCEIDALGGTLLFKPIIKILYMNKEIEINYKQLFLNNMIFIGRTTIDAAGATNIYTATRPKNNKNTTYDKITQHDGLKTMILTGLDEDPIYLGIPFHLNNIKSDYISWYAKSANDNTQVQLVPGKCCGIEITLNNDILQPKFINSPNVSNVSNFTKQITKNQLDNKLDNKLVCACIGIKRVGDWLQASLCKRDNFLLLSMDFWCIMFALLIGTPILIDEYIYNNSYIHNKSLETLKIINGNITSAESPVLISPFIQDDISYKGIQINFQNIDYFINKYLKYKYKYLIKKNIELTKNFTKQLIMKKSYILNTDMNYNKIQKKYFKYKCKYIGDSDKIYMQHEILFIEILKIYNNCEDLINIYIEKLQENGELEDSHTYDEIVIIREALDTYLLGFCKLKSILNNICMDTQTIYNPIIIFLQKLPVLYELSDTKRIIDDFNKDYFDDTTFSSQIKTRAFTTYMVNFIKDYLYLLITNLNMQTKKLNDLIIN